MAAAAALGALCRAGGWSYAAIWRSDRRDPRLLTIGECRCEDAARKVVEKMVNQVHVVGEGVIGRALLSGESLWISDDRPFSFSQTSDADNLGLFQGCTWWQHQFLSGIKTIAVVPIPAFGVAQFGSMQKVDESLEFVDQVKDTFCVRESFSQHPSSDDIQKDVFPCNPQFQLNCPSTTEGLVCIKAEPENIKPLDNTRTIDSLKSFASTSSNYPCSNGFASYGSCSGLNPHIVAMPVNSKSINSVRLFPNVSYWQHNNSSENMLQSKSSKQSDSSLASTTIAHSSLNSLPRMEHELPGGPNKQQYHFESEKSSCFVNSYTSCFSVDGELKSTLFTNATSFVQSSQKVNATGSTSHANCEVQELPVEIWGETAAGMINPVRGDNENTELLESTVFDPVMHDWWDDPALLAGHVSHATAKDPVTEQTSSNPSTIEERGLFSESVIEELLGFGGNAGPIVASSDQLLGSVSGCQLPSDNLQDSVSVSKAPIPSVTVPSGSCTSENVPIGAPKAIPVSLRTLSMDDCCSLNTANSKVSQVKKPDGAKVIKKRARPGESTRPRPKDRQLIQERVKELREIVPNSAKCSIDALLDRTIKHMLFLQSVTKYAEKIKQADEPKMISNDSCAVLNDNSSGVVLKDDAGSNGGATWAYEVAGQTMVCPIIVEDLAPPGQMLVEMLCEERGFFLEIADTIRGFGLMILKGLMELRDGKIMARFLVEANKNVTRMDIFLSLVQLLQQNSLNRSSDQLAKVINNGVPSFAEHQQSPVSIPVGLAER
ncbi:hypothetical protein ACP70R_027581 [Stipagrostis hirtigluma subsp. patula]